MRWLPWPGWQLKLKQAGGEYCIARGEMRLTRWIKRTIILILLMALISLLSTWNGGSEKHLAVIIPVYERATFHSLLVSIHPLNAFIKSQVPRYSLHVVQQINDFRYNRGYLVDIIYDVVRSKCDYIVIQDAKLIPANKALSYRYPPADQAVVLHLNESKYLRLEERREGHFNGGALVLRNEVFEMVDGMSTLIWGGGSDDYKNFMARLQNKGIEVTKDGKHNNIISKYWQTLSSGVRRKSLVKTDNSGLSTMFGGYTIQKEWKVGMEGLTVNFYKVHLECNIKVTPECQIR